MTMKNESEMYFRGFLPGVIHFAYDESQQGKGYGRAALNQIIEYIKAKPFGDSSRIALTCNKNNYVARALYENIGFSVTGVEDEDEIELVMNV
ncbi:MAG: GNAT family N-acetyltransferase [Lachnospiraceae bacterium]|nr:GNAT family N-acetyltransferase [Lachnospiraceae bacterium]